MTRTELTLKLLRKGWTTSLECALRGGCLSLSQRVSEMRRDGLTVLDRWVDTPGRARVKAYRLPRRAA